MNRYRLFYYWTDRKTGGCEKVSMDLNAFTAADAIVQAELQIKNTRHVEMDRYYHGIMLVEPIPAHPEAPALPLQDQPINKDHATVARLLAGKIIRWELLCGGPKGELCYGGLRYGTDVDEYGVPRLTDALRAAIAKAEGR